MNKRNERGNSKICKTLVYFDSNQKEFIRNISSQKNMSISFFIWDCIIRITTLEFYAEQYKMKGRKTKHAK